MGGELSGEWKITYSEIWLVILRRGMESLASIGSRLVAFDNLKSVHLVYFLIDLVQPLQQVHQVGEQIPRQVFGAHFRVEVLLQQVTPCKVFQSVSSKGMRSVS